MSHLARDWANSRLAQDMVYSRLAQDLVYSRLAQDLVYSRLEQDLVVLPNLAYCHPSLYQILKHWTLCHIEFASEFTNIFLRYSLSVCGIVVKKTLHIK